MNRNTLKFIRIMLRVFIPVMILTMVYLPVSSYVSIQKLPQPIQKIAQNLEPKVAQAHADDIFVFITVASNSELSNSWPVPADWNPASNSIEVIGAGAAGG